MYIFRLEMKNFGEIFRFPTRDREVFPPALPGFFSAYARIKH